MLQLGFWFRIRCGLLCRLSVFFALEENRLRLVREIEIARNPFCFCTPALVLAAVSSVKLRGNNHNFAFGPPSEERTIFRLASYPLPVDICVSDREIEWIVSDVNLSVIQGWIAH